MKCDKALEMLAEQWAGSLNADEKIQFELHLNECARCREEYESLERLWTDLARIPTETPGAAMRSRFYAMLAEYRGGVDPSPHASLISKVRGWFRPGIRLAPAYQLGLGALMLACGFLSGYLIRSMQNGSPELSELRTEVREMRQMMSLSLLKQQSASERLKGVSWSSQVSHPDPEFLETLVHTLNADPNVDVRLASVDALARFAGNPSVRLDLIRSLPGQDSPLVQISLIDLLVQLHERQSVKAFRQIIEDTNQNPQVRARAQWGLQNIS